MEAVLFGIVGMVVLGKKGKIIRQNTYNNYWQIFLRNFLDLVVDLGKSLNEQLSLYFISRQMLIRSSKCLKTHEMMSQILSMR